MSSFEKLLERLSDVGWSAESQDYEPTALEMEGVVQYLNSVAVLVQEPKSQESQHVLTSPARLLGYEPSLSLADVINTQAAKVPDAYARVLVKNAMEWAAMTSDGRLPAGSSPDLFEPLLSLLTRGCRIRLSKGFLEVGGNVLPLHNWPNSLKEQSNTIGDVP